MGATPHFLPCYGDIIHYLPLKYFYASTRKLQTLACVSGVHTMTSVCTASELQGPVIDRKCKGSFCSSLYWWRSELLHVETASCYRPLQQRTKTAQMCSMIGQVWEGRSEAFVSRCVELLCPYQ